MLKKSSRLTQVQNLPKALAIGLIRVYQVLPFHLSHGSCRFQPTCSHYTLGAISRFGVLKGGWLGVKRLVKCGPFHPGGYDPIPENFVWFKQLNKEKD